ncbi:hypothetical protein SEA_PIONEER_61 [Mycobacterium phage Pioneer]|uniref:Uncharacterized protein n=2 Tax=Fromanvirus packman TaxID=1034142 RepID=A0A1C9M1L2_9CAUD|nr:hypothetical protein AVV05_gp048 [Mycobacterium phage Pioneer]YP_009301884.1 hypothetical protein BJD80_gp049 [Mycobacterium phage Catalina]AOQ29017.1 hypothetical protein SEA_HORTUMSL17_61 [Mycobacterium phage HortumSL17]AVI04241.1 hypothetical protein SEA_PHONNEGUT_61 [Mycobacterium phage Phonnegut]AVI04378.1 hypothetical protein SEA_SCHERZO_61 [Mycobacterium phage Scherzo]QBI96377.1 hypothetical protein SEA_UGENIE5_57 [Mycobacterium phage Ugenie5]QGH80527.1 hypothetical protein SEA_ALIT
MSRCIAYEYQYRRANDLCSCLMKQCQCVCANGDDVCDRECECD